MNNQALPDDTQPWRKHLRGQDSNRRGGTRCRGFNRATTKNNNPCNIRYSFHQNILDNVLVTCSVCHRQRSAFSKCYECDRYMCLECRQAHNDRKVNGHHHVFVLEPNTLKLCSEEVNNHGHASESNASTPNQGDGSNDSPKEQFYIELSGDELNASSKKYLNCFTLNSEASSISPPSHCYEATSSIPFYDGITPSFNLSYSTPSSSATSPASFIDSFTNLTISQKNTLLPYTECGKHCISLAYFCVSCRVAVCFLCKMELHVTHQVIPLDNAAGEVKRDAEELTGDLRNLNRNLKGALDEMQRTCEAITENAFRAALDVRCVTRRFMHALEYRQDMMLQQIEQARRVKLTNLQFQMENIRRRLERLANATDLVRHSASFSHPLPMVAVNENAVSEIRSTSCLGTALQPMENEVLNYGVADRDEWLVRLRYMGELKTLIPPPSGVIALVPQPLLFMRDNVAQPQTPLSKPFHGRPILGCLERVCVKRHCPVPAIISGPGTTEGLLRKPWGLAINRAGQMIVADRGNHRIQVLNHKGDFEFEFGGYGSKPGELNTPAGVAVNYRDDIVVVDKDNHRVQVFTRQGEFMFGFGEEGACIGQFSYPWGVACDNVGNIAVVDGRNRRVQLFRWNGVFIAKFGNEPDQPRIFEFPRGVAFDPYGNLLVTDFELHKIVKIEVETKRMIFVGKLGEAAGELNRPQGVVCDDSGNYVVADSKNSRYQVFNRYDRLLWACGRHGSGTIGEMERPCDVALDRFGHVCVMDLGNDRIQKM